MHSVFDMLLKENVTTQMDPNNYKNQQFSYISEITNKKNSWENILIIITIKSTKYLAMSSKEIGTNIMEKIRKHE